MLKNRGSHRGTVCLLNFGVIILLTALLPLALGAAPKGGKDKGGDDTSGSGGGGGKVKCTNFSQASLELDTCGCATAFGDPSCNPEVTWDLSKERLQPVEETVEDQDEVDFEFSVTVNKTGPDYFLDGDGVLSISNSGEQTARLANCILQLETEKLDANCPAGTTESVGPSGENWCVLRTAVARAAGNLCAEGTARSCYHDGDVNADAGSRLNIDLTDSLVEANLVDHDGDGEIWEDTACGLDNDNDGSVDEDPADGIDNDQDGREGPGSAGYDCADGIDNDDDGLVDGLDAGCADAIDEDTADDDYDGEIDEDGPCVGRWTEDLTFRFDITSLVDSGQLQGGESLRLNLMATYTGAGPRSRKDKAGCTLDVDCDGSIDQDLSCPDGGAASCEGQPDGCSGRINESERDNVRTHQQRKEFVFAGCPEPFCDNANLEDPGAFVDERPECVNLDNLDTVSELLNDDFGTLVGGTALCAHDPIAALPDELDRQVGLDGVAKLRVRHPGTNFGAPSYFDATLTEAGDFNGQYDDYCVDTDNTIASNTTYCVELISSYDTSKTGSLVEMPENLDTVNWVINQDFTDQTCASAGRNYTFGDIQRAIWWLVEDQQSTSGLGVWSEACAQEILNAAANSGEAEGFEPDCSQRVAIIMNPIGQGDNCTSNTVAQITIAQVQMISIPGVCPSTDPCISRVCDQATLTCESEADPFASAQDCFFIACPEPPPTPTVEEGGVENKIKGYGDRYRSFGNTGAAENYLGRGDLGVAGNRVERNFNKAWGTVNGVEFIYSVDNDRLTSKVDIGNDGSVDFTLEYTDVASKVAALGNGCTVDTVDFMEIIVAGRDAGTTVEFNDVSLDGHALGDFDGTGGFFVWTVRNFDFTQGFTLTGKIVLSGTFSTSQERSRVELGVACDGS